jgi:(1->4)-alpha-D-glucan 1-alpha-D-glucosylmutase
MIATYRLQFNRTFKLTDGREIVDYLHDLGIDTVYSSPIFKARSGSMHGYDVTDPTQINPEIGGKRAFDALSSALRRHGMRLLLDIVPNHMATGEENRWWRDVLQKGKSSKFARFFDIDWEKGRGRVVLPDLPDDQPDRIEDFAVHTYWKSGLKKMNYRRFFNVSDLVGVRVEDEEVFRATHGLTLKLIRERLAHGIRIDHIDGLLDPAEYLERLRREVGPDVPIVVEKILGEHETLPRWPIQGTTGYDYVNALNGLFVSPEGLSMLTALHGGLDFGTQVYRAKRFVLRWSFQGELRGLVPGRGRRALIEVTACMPVYRTYVRRRGFTDKDRKTIERAFLEARMRSGLDLDPIRPVLLPRKKDHRNIAFIMRWQQITGPTMAKGVEDTALYRHNVLTSLNEVGTHGRPLSVEEFHRLNARRGGSLNPTSTHDTKRSEDVRARINVLSELAAEWSALVRRWIQKAPDRSLGHLFYQSLAGAWPLREDEIDEFRDRMQDYMLKSAREAKIRTSWIAPNLDFESRLATFVENAFNARFVEEFLPFQRRVAFFGAINSLSQVVLKIASPGVPDFYQGNETWDLSLVDPDNRRPVDFRKRREMLDSLAGAEIAGMLDSWRDGRIKLFVTQRGLVHRRDRALFYRTGRYVPLRAVGARGAHVVAFARHSGHRWVVAVVCRFPASIVPAGRFPLGDAIWRHTILEVPRHAPAAWRDVYTGKTLHRPLSLGALFNELPVALIESS